LQAEDNKKQMHQQSSLKRNYIQSTGYQDETSAKQFGVTYVNHLQIKMHAQFSL